MDFEVKTVIDNIDDMTDIIKNQLNDIAEGFVSVGYYLRKTDETMLYKQKGHKTIYEYAKDTFGIGRSTASRFMEINQKYSKDGYSPEIDLKWSGYGSSKLTEMLGLPEDVQEAIPVDATVRDIRDAKGIIRETEHNYSAQMELCDIAQPDPVETNWLTELIKQYFSKENREAFQKMTDWLRKDEPEKDITVSILLIINPTKFKMIRLERANVMLTVDKIKVMPYRNQGEQQEYTYIDFGRAFETMFYPAGVDTPINEAYKNVYGESYYKEKHYPGGKNDANDTGNRESAPKDEAGTDRSVSGETRTEGASETSGAYLDKDGMLKHGLVFNYNIDYNKFESRIKMLYSTGYMAGKSYEDYIAHEMAHIIPFQNCVTKKDYDKLTDEIYKSFVKGISKYADKEHDGRESLAEAFVRYRNGEKIPDESRKLIEKYILPWRRK